jgi:hypothetical protein
MERIRNAEYSTKNYKGLELPVCKEKTLTDMVLHRNIKERSHFRDQDYMEKY